MAHSRMNGTFPAESVGGVIGGAGHDADDSHPHSLASVSVLGRNPHIDVSHDAGFGLSRKEEGTPIFEDRFYIDPRTEIMTDKP